MQHLVVHHSGDLGAFLGAVRIVWPFLVVPAVIAGATGLIQSRLALSFTAVKPKWERVDPAQGFRRLLSSRGAVEVLRAIVKLVAVATVAYLTVRADWTLLTNGGQGGAAVGALGRVLWDLWLRIGLVFFVIAAPLVPGRAPDGIEKNRTILWLGGAATHASKSAGLWAITRNFMYACESPQNSLHCPVYTPGSSAVPGMIVPNTSTSFTNSFCRMDVIS